MNPFTKVKKYAQRAASAGWNQHVNSWQRKKANKIIRRILAKDMKDSI